MKTLIFTLFLAIPTSLALGQFTKHNPTIEDIGLTQFVYSTGSGPEALAVTETYVLHDKTEIKSTYVMINPKEKLCAITYGNPFENKSLYLKALGNVRVWEDAYVSYATRWNKGRSMTLEVSDRKNGSAETITIEFSPISVKEAERLLKSSPYWDSEGSDELDYVMVLIDTNANQSSHTTPASAPR